MSSFESFSVSSLLSSSLAQGSVATMSWYASALTNPAVLLMTFKMPLLDIHFAGRRTKRRQKGSPCHYRSTSTIHSSASYSYKLMSGRYTQALAFDDSQMEA